MKPRGAWIAGVALVLSAVLGSGGLYAAEKLAEVDISTSSLAVRPLIDNDGLSVTVTGPDGLALSRSFGPDDSAVLALVGVNGGALADGVYHYEVSLNARGDKAALAASREAQDSGAAARTEGPSLVERGTFRITAGVVDTGGAVEVQAGARRLTTNAGSDAPVPPTPDDFVINDDLIVTQSACVGNDCVNGEDFGFDTIRLKENNTRLQFNDTSVGSFPTNNWQIRANSSSSGGANFLAFVDQGTSGTSETGTLVFGVDAGAGANALWVSSAGRVGLGTSTPVQDIHVKTGNTPSMRLEQDGSSGFAPQSWDVAGNETNFFIRDVTSGSTLPFRIRPGAPNSAIDISSTGFVGVGTSSPAKGLHVSRSDGNAQVRVDETNGTATLRTLMALTNNGPVRSTWSNTDNGTTWAFDNDASSNFTINNIGNAGVEFTLSPTGNLTITGTYSPSDRALKKDVVEVQPQEVLAKVVRIPISTWRYKEGNSDLHMGPMAQDFVGAFGVGPDDKRISASDMGGVALAAIQALNEVVQSENARLRKENAELAERLAAVEKALAAK